MVTDETLDELVDEANEAIDRAVRKRAINTDNLLKLAVYLENLPRHYVNFDMSTFFTRSERIFQSDIFEIREEMYHECGTVACALGHGPAAGLGSKQETYSWGEYSKQVLGFSWCSEFGMGDVWDWCFSGGWSNNQPHHWEAAARIRYVLDNDLTPPKGWQQEIDDTIIHDGEETCDYYEEEQIVGVFPDIYEVY